MADMSIQFTINAVLSSPFPGLPSLTIPLPASSSLHLLHQTIAGRLPDLISDRFYLSTISGRILSPTDSTTSLTAFASNDLLPLRLSATLLGGKGGFGSQLRAAGGRMSSRKKRGQEENSDSCRNLDGRRIRTVKEAKALAAYLEIKPEMERKEKEKRKERWMKIVEMAEKREAIDRGEDMGGFRFDDTKWLEQTEEEKERTREAVLKAMRDGAFVNGVVKKEDGPDNSSGTSSGVEDEEMEEMPSPSGAVAKAATLAATRHTRTTSASLKVAPKFHGFDEDDEFMGSDDEMEGTGEPEEEAEEDVKGKGKAKEA